MNNEFFDLLTREEDLLPELLPYLSDSPSLGNVLHHPYLIQFMVDPKHCGLYNVQYKTKKEAIEKAIAIGNYQRALWFHERPYRLQALLKFQEKMDDKEWWKMVSSIWTDSENIHENFDEWCEIWTSSRKSRQFVMDAGEQKFYKTLPKTLTLYRGYFHQTSKRGLSWTLNRQKAEWFADRFYNSQGKGSVAQIEISKEFALAYFSGRNEDEIVVSPIYFEV